MNGSRRQVATLCVALTLAAIFAAAAGPVPVEAEEDDCSRFVDLAGSDLRSAVASVTDGEYETALDLLASAESRLSKAAICLAERCSRAAEIAGCPTYLQDAKDAVQAACRDILNGAYGDATDQLGSAAGALTAWVQCVRDNCR